MKCDIAITHLTFQHKLCFEEAAIWIPREKQDLTSTGWAKLVLFIILDIRNSANLYGLVIFLRWNATGPGHLLLESSTYKNYDDIRNM